MASKIAGTYPPGLPFVPSDFQISSVSVRQALRSNPGKYQVNGMLVSLSSIFKLVAKEKWLCLNCDEEVVRDHSHRPVAMGNKPEDCSRCGGGLFKAQHEYANALAIELKDPIPVNELESLHVVLLNEATNDVRAGEEVSVEGMLDVVPDIRRRRLAPEVQASTLRYKRREESVLSERDVQSLRRFAEMPDLRNRLISMSCLPIIGYDRVKMGLLRSVAGAPGNAYIRGRIHTVLAGDVGTSKSMCLRETVKLLPNSWYVTAQNASGKSLTAIVDKANDTTTLRLGPIPLAKNSICAINELGLMNPEDQGYLLDAMEEGFFSIAKHGISAKIDSPTTIIATTNQRNAQWINDESVSNDEIPLMKTVLDRMDQVFVIRDFANHDDAKAYALKKSEIDRKAGRFNYRFLRKYLQYSRTIDPIMSPEADAMLGEYWLQMRASGRAGPRALEGLKRLAKSQARLYLKDVVSADTAKEVMSDYSEILQDYGRTVATIADPREVALKECLAILCEMKSPITFEDLVKAVCLRNEQVLHYLVGDTKLDGRVSSYKLRYNYKLRPLLDMLLNHESVMQVGQRPVTLEWKKGGENKGQN